MLIKFEKMNKMLDKNVMGFVIEVHTLKTLEMENVPVPDSVATILAGFAEVFVEPKGLPPRRECDHAIPLKMGAEPPNQRPYRVPHQQKNAMEEIIKELLESEEIRPNLSPYSSPAVMVRKRDGSWRMCVDYRQLNARTIKNKFPMPIVEDLLDELNGAKVFSKLDLRSGYHQIRMVESDIPKTAFKTHMGHFEYLVMPFGLTNAPVTFQALMNQIFEKLLRKCVLVFFDDILIYSKNLEEHEKQLQCVLSILRSHKLYAKRSKCTFAAPSVEYLGHIVSGEGVATKPSKIKDVLEWAVPVNITKLRGFLRLTGYYRRFVQGYGAICRPLHDLLKKDNFHWGPEQQKAFDQLKKIMTTCPVLALPDFSKPFVLETDACGSSIGAVLMQEGRPIAYYSKALGQRAAGSSTYEKEAIAILEALKKWRHYLLGNQVIIRIDQQSLKYMATHKLSEGIQHKLLLKLLEFDYNIEYKKGKENAAADALSRRDTKEVEEKEKCYAITLVYPEWIEDVKSSYLNDAQYMKLVDGEELNEESSNFSLGAGILRYKNRIYVGSTTNIRNKLIQAFHKSAFGGHSGVKVTYHRIKKIFYWPQLKKEVEKIVSECPTCQITKAEHVHSPGLLDPLQIPEMAWTHISMDFIEGLPKSQGKDVILVVVDRLTKYAYCNVSSL